VLERNPLCSCTETFSGNKTHDPGRRGDVSMGPWTEDTPLEVQPSKSKLPTCDMVLDPVGLSDLPPEMMEKFSSAAGNHSKKLGAQNSGPMEPNPSTSTCSGSSF